MKKIYADTILMVTAVVWGGGFIATGGALDVLSPLYIMMIRLVGATVFPLLTRWRRLRKLDRTTTGHGIVTGIFLFLAFVSRTFGLRYPMLSKSASLTATNVMFVPYLFWLLQHRRPSCKELIASLPCVVGITLLTLKKDTLALGFGDMLSPVCASSFVLYIITLERYPAYANTVCMTALQMMTAGVISTVYALTLEQPLIPSNWHAVGNVTYLIFMPTLLAYLPQAFTQRFTTANSASLILSMETLFVPIPSFLLLGEVVSPPMILGVYLIFPSILYTEHKPAWKKKDEQQDTC